MMYAEDYRQASVYSSMYNAMGMCVPVHRMT